jgi:hypothetical protein
MDGQHASASLSASSMRLQQGRGQPASASSMHAGQQHAPAMQDVKKRPRGNTVTSCLKYMYFLEKSD